jgi:hypothetical protein
MAVHFLQEACEDKDILQLVVEMQPTMDHLGAIGHPLLLKCVHAHRAILMRLALLTPPLVDLCRRRWDSGIYMMLGILIAR